MITMTFPILYGEDKTIEEIQNIKRILEILYDEYVDFMSLENPSFAPPQHQT